MNRRTVLKGGIVLAITSHTAVASGEGIVDPIITALRDLREGEAAFDAIKEEDWHLHGGEDAVIAKTYGPPLDVVDEWDRPAETMEGALEALRFARQEADTFSSSPAVPRMISAALVYLEALS